MLSLETGDDDVRDREYTDQEDRDVKSAHQLVVAECEADDRVDRRHTDCGKHDADQACDQAVQHILAGQGCDDGQSEHCYCKIVSRAEKEADAGQQR